MDRLSTLYVSVTSFFKSLINNTVEVNTVQNVDLERYMGRWYEISSYPQWYERGLTGVSALYTAKDGYVEIVNSGYKNGKIKEAHGKATVVPNSGGSKLKVTFFPPFYGKYWIIDLAEDYTWVVISNPNRSTLWVMCREKIMNQTLYRSILNRLRSKGFDISKLVDMKPI